MSKLPMIPATVIGSWAFPGWYAKFCDDVARQPELFGEDDRSEAVLDAVRLAVDDQLRAGADLITDGEMQRVDFNLGFYDYLKGVEPLPPARRWGPPAHDQRSRYRCVAPLTAPSGLGVVAEYRRLRTITPAPVKVPVPGPFTLAGCLNGGEVYRDRREITEALLPLVNREMRALVAQLALEFASREMAEIELAREIRPPMGLAAGLVDVKNTWVEPPELVAERLRTVLKYIDPERVHVTPDCGFSQTARFIATRKLASMVQGVRLVRQELKRPV